jgi:hypothetical protein
MKPDDRALEVTLWSSSAGVCLHLISIEEVYPCGTAPLVMNHDTVTAITHLPAVDIVTYRLNGKLVYVTPTTKYDVRLLWMSLYFLS